MFAIGLALVVVAGALQMAVEVAQAANFAVTAANSTFEDGSGDQNTAIDVGDTVTWTFSDGQPHTVTADGGAFASGAPATSGTFAFTFNSAGTFDYYCEVHGGAGGLGMSGTITVQAAPTNTPPAATNTAPAGATNTPTRTRTPTPRATSTGTVTPAPTTAAPTLTPIVAVPISATEPAPAGGPQPVIIAPAVGTGDATSGAGLPLRAFSIALGVAGALLIVGAAVAKSGD
jgi:plastocyanin